MTIEQRLKDLATRHCVPITDTLALYHRLQEQGATPAQALQAIRAGYAEHTGIHEYFTAEDIAAALEIPVSEAAKLLDQYPDKMTVTFPSWMQ